MASCVYQPVIVLDCQFVMGDLSRFIVLDCQFVMGDLSRFGIRMNHLVCGGPGYHSRYSDSLRAGRSWDRIPAGARFSVPVQTGPRAHPASCTVGTGSYPEVERSGRGVDHPPPSSAEVKERVELYLYSSSGPSWPVSG